MSSSNLLQQFANRDLSIDIGILAGGRGERMGGVDKGLQKLNDKPLIEYALEQLSTLSERDIMISCNRHLEEYARYSTRLFKDIIPNFKGPMAGLHTLLSNSTADYLLVFPCDTPFCTTKVAKSLLQQLLIQLDQNTIPVKAIAIQNEFSPQPLHLVISKSLCDSLQQSLLQSEHKIVRWLNDNEVHWLRMESSDAEFINLNSIAELDENSSN